MTQACPGGVTVKIKVPMVDDEVLQDDERSKKTKSVFPCLAADISRLEPSCLPKGQIINPPCSWYSAGPFVSFKHVVVCWNGGG